MSTKSIGRIYLRREKDILYLLSVFVETKDNSIYFSMPMSDEQRKAGIDNVKTSYHPDGQTHLTSQIPELKKIDDNLKRSTTKKMGFNGDKVYVVSLKNTPLADITEITKMAQGASYKDINNINHSSYKVVEFKDIKWGSNIIDSQNYQHLSFNYYLVPNNSIKDMSGHIDNEYFIFGHPILDMSVVVRIFDHWKD